MIYHIIPTAVLAMTTISGLMAIFGLWMPWSFLVCIFNWKIEDYIYKMLRL